MDGPLPQCSESDQHEDFDFQVMTDTKMGKLLVHEQIIIFESHPLHAVAYLNVNTGKKVILLDF